MRREQSALGPPLVEPDCWAPERLLLDPVAKWSELTENIAVALQGYDGRESNKEHCLDPNRH